MLGRRRIAVKFRIHKSISGIARSRYNNPDNILESKDNIEIAKLRRLADNHAQEIDVTRVPPSPTAGESDDTIPFEPKLEDLPWMEMKKRVHALGHETFSITKKECLMILRAHRATTPEDSDGKEENTDLQS